MKKKIVLLLMAMAFTGMAGVAQAAPAVVASPNPATVYYVPTSGGAIVASFDVSPSGFSGDVVSIDWSSVTDWGVVSASSGISSDVATTMVLSFPQTGASSLSLDLVPVQTVSDMSLVAATSDDGSVSPAAIGALTFKPTATSFDVSSNTAVLVASGDDYTCTLGLNASSINLEASWDNTLATNVKFDVGAPIAVPFGNSGTSGVQSVSLGVTPHTEGSVATVQVIMNDYVDASGTVSTKVRTIHITFSANSALCTPVPMNVDAYYTCPLSLDVTVTPVVAGGSVTLISLDPTPVNGVSAVIMPVSGDTIKLSGTPAVNSGSSSITYAADVNGTYTTGVFTIDFKEPAISLAPATVSATVGASLTQAISVTSVPSDAVLGTISVTPTTANGVTATVSGDSVVFSGTPMTATSSNFMVSAAVGSRTESAFVTVTAVTAGSSALVSPSAGNWNGTYNSSTGAFSMSTSVISSNLPAGVTVTGVTPTFNPAAAVTGVTTSVSATGVITVSGVLVSPYTTNDVKITDMQYMLSDGTTRTQSGLIGITLANVMGDDGDSGGGGCDAFGLGFASLALAVLALKRRV